MNVNDNDEKSSLLKESLLVRVRNSQNLQGNNNTNTAGAYLQVNTQSNPVKESGSNGCFYLILVTSTLLWIIILISVWTKH